MREPEPCPPPRAIALPEAVFFDMDGLLVDSEPLWFEVETAAMERMGGSWSHEDQHALIGGSLQRSLEYMLARAARPTTPERLSRWLLERMVDVLASRVPPMLPGARELLAGVDAAGIPRALVTSSAREIMDAMLAALDVTFGASVCAADVKHGKPHPEPYLLAARRLGVDPQRCVALEDSPNGVTSAQSAGCMVIAVPGLVPIPQEPRRVVLGSLTEMSADVMRQLAAAWSSGSGGGGSGAGGSGAGAHGAGAHGADPHGADPQRDGPR